MNQKVLEEEKKQLKSRVNMLTDKAASSEQQVQGFRQKVTELNIELARQRKDLFRANKRNR